MTRKTQLHESTIHEKKTYEQVNFATRRIMIDEKNRAKLRKQPDSELHP